MIPFYFNGQTGMLVVSDDGIVVYHGAWAGYAAFCRGSLRAVVESVLRSHGFTI